VFGREHLRGFLRRVRHVGIDGAFVFLSPDHGMLAVCRAEQLSWKALVCVHWQHGSYPQDGRPAGIVGQMDPVVCAKFEVLPVLLAYGFDAVWLDLDVYLVKDPTDDFRGFLKEYDVVSADHVDSRCLNNGVFAVRSSDESVMWSSAFLAWLHWNPFGHDQNGFDAFLGHSIKDPYVDREGSMGSVLPYEMDAEIRRGLLTPPKLRVHVLDMKVFVDTMAWPVGRSSSPQGAALAVSSFNDLVLLHLTRDKSHWLRKLLYLDDGTDDDALKEVQWDTVGDLLARLRIDLPDIRTGCYAGGMSVAPYRVQVS
jgi:hypothetical protein